MDKWKEWAKAAGVRAVKTMAQAALAIIGTTAVLSEIDWKVVLSSALVAGIASVLTSLAGLPEVKTQYDEEGTTRDDIEVLDGDEEGEEDDEDE